MGRCILILVVVLTTKIIILLLEVLREVVVLCFGGLTPHFGVLAFWRAGGL